MVLIKKIYALILSVVIGVTVYEIVFKTPGSLDLKFKADEYSLLNLLSFGIFEKTSTADNRPLYILIMSSNPRSGSTMFSEIISTRNNSVLFFEPLWDQMKKPCFQNGNCTSTFLHDVFNCSYDQDFEDWFRAKRLFIHYYHPNVHHCGNSQCLRDLDIRGLCQNTTTRIMKVIRSRLSWLKPLLSDLKLNLKVLYLTRDPRGSITSIKSFRWDASPKLRCGNMLDDMQEYEKLKTTYPGKIMSVSLEILSLDTINTMKQIHSFLYDNSTLPWATLEYIKTHFNATENSRGTMDTKKNSEIEYQAWRLKISSTLLRTIEDEPACVSVIGKMGHVLFRSFTNVRNYTISLWKT
ncbi:hypothetical protein SK128_026866 [Halocaridina rubra]|uniref:Sulfotransferase domain-containing protein n=1 Tax=Halocaridina rubra TaxID=373956 RepID=A0AAN8WY95_HALRR